MSDQFAIGLLIQMVDELKARMESLEDRLAAIEDGEDESPETYLDGSKV